jgi:hypothetical protein
LAYHAKRCKPPQQYLQNAILEEVIKKQGDMIKDMQTKLACLEKRTELPHTNNTINTNTSNTTTNTNNSNNTANNAETINQIYITYQNFGEENKEYITAEFARQCFENGESGIISMLNKIYFNEEHNENHNVRMKSLKNQLVDVFSNQKWVTKGFNDTVKKMINTSSDEIMKEVIPTIMSREPSIELLNNMTEVSTASPKLHKTIKEKTKAALVERQKHVDSQTT